MLLDTVRKFSLIHGVSGCEEEVRYEILREIEGHCIYRVDPLGNILAFKKGKKTPKYNLMLSAHMDEVGLIITYIEESGLLRFAEVGGIDKRVLIGKSVLIGKTFGVIGTKAVHMKSSDEKEKAIDSKDLYIDIGARDKTHAQSLVQLGDRAVFNSEYAFLGEDLIRGRALDDRIGCALLIELLKNETEYDVHVAFTVQEETGTIGAKTAASQISPDIALIVETTTACDIPGVTADKTVCALKKGPVLSFMDKGTLYDMALYTKALKVAEEKGIKCQSKAGVYGGNESRSIQVSGSGVRVLAVSVPCRYLHTPSCVASRSDIEETLRLLTALIEGFAE